jgi:uncharacterized protein (TIGR02001 family)
MVYCRALLAAGLAVVPIAGASGEFSGVATLTSEYIHQGKAMSDGNPAVQVRLDYENKWGFFAGAWGSTVDLSNPGGRRDMQLDYYVGYHYASDSPLSLAATLVRYTYPGQTGFIDYDYTQAVVTAALYERYSVEFGYSPEIYGFDASGHYWELRGDWPLKSGWVIGAGLGQKDLSELGSNRYLYWDVGASARVSSVVVDLRWYDNEKPGGFYRRLSADSQFVVSLSLPY